MCSRRPKASTTTPVRRGGGIAVIYNNRFTAKRIEFEVKPATFEVLGCIIRSSSINNVYVVVYRPACDKPTDELFAELTALLEIVVIYRSQYIITGDFNAHVNDPEDLLARRFLNLIESFDLVQSVTGLTQKNGNTLDLIITYMVHC